jgi:hypothetical protein
VVVPPLLTIPPLQPARLAAIIRGMIAFKTVSGFDSADVIRVALVDETLRTLQAGSNLI